MIETIPTLVETKTCEELHVHPSLHLMLKLFMNVACTTSRSNKTCQHCQVLPRLITNVLTLMFTTSQRAYPYQKASHRLVWHIRGVRILVLQKIKYDLTLQCPHTPYTLTLSTDDRDHVCSHCSWLLSDNWRKSRRNIQSNS